MGILLYYHKSKYISNINNTAKNSNLYLGANSDLKIWNTNIYIYGYKGDILASRGSARVDNNNNIITAKHNIYKTGLVYEIYNSDNQTKYEIDDMIWSGEYDIAIIKSSKLIDHKYNNISNKYMTNDNAKNSGYIYINGSAEEWQSGSPVYCQNNIYVCGIVIANNDHNDQVKVLLINKEMINNIK